MGTSGGGADRCRIQGFHFPHCIVNGVLSLPCGIYKDHFNTAAKLIPRETYKIKGFIIFTGPRERDKVFLERHAKSPKSPKFGLDSQEESRAKTHRQVPLLRVRGGELVACGKHSHWVMNWVKMERRKEVKW